LPQSLTPDLLSKSSGLRHHRGSGVTFVVLVRGAPEPPRGWRKVVGRPARLAAADHGLIGVNVDFLK
jgi:hypothetical protein